MTRNWLALASLTGFTFLSWATVSLANEFFRVESRHWKGTMPHNKRMQPVFGELALVSAADARRYASK